MQENVYCFNRMGDRIPSYDPAGKRPDDLKFIYCTDEKAARKYLRQVIPGLYVYDVRAGFVGVPPSIAEVVLYLLGQLPDVMSRRPTA